MEEMEEGKDICLMPLFSVWSGSHLWRIVVSKRNRWGTSCIRGEVHGNLIPSSLHTSRFTDWANSSLLLASLSGFHHWHYFEATRRKLWIVWTNVLFEQMSS